jgi:hypothetical protein
MRWLALSAMILGGCGLDLDPAPPIIHARFDPDAKVIPMPSDVLRDAGAGRLALPLDGDLTAAELELYTWLNQMDGWSSAASATVELTGAIDRATVTADTVQVWEWRETPLRVTDATIEVAADERSITIHAPRTGWSRGARYLVMMRGGERGVEGKAGEKVECDAAFYFLRQTERLDVAAHERAFPGATRQERRAAAARLEAIRTELSPMFDFFADRDVPRDDVAALWAFTVTERVELAMDEPSQRMPLPIDLLVDPATGRIHLPPAAWDSPTVLDAKEALGGYDGFGVSAGMLFGFTGPVDPATIARDTVELWRIVEGGAPVREPAQVALLPDRIHVEITPEAAPLPERTTFAVVVRDRVRDAAGRPVVMMPAGRLMQARSPVFVDGASQVGAVDDDDARKLERVRADTRAFLDDIGAPASGDVLAAWTFTTMSVTEPIERWIAQPGAIGVSPHPTEVRRESPWQSLSEFGLAINSLLYVEDVYHGRIATPVFLDPLTRGFRHDGGHRIEEVAFTMTVPRRTQTAAPLPVVIFGHGIMTERKFVLAVGDSLARAGFAAIAIDMPYHGERTYCWEDGPLTVPNPSTGDLVQVAQICQGGGSCSPDGRCVDAHGAETGFARWPIVSMPVASGAAFIEVDKISNTRDHFIQSEIDLGALLRSLREGNWAQAIGAPIDTSKIYYAGQSLGGILGATFVALHPQVGTAVLNVPGADTVDMFRESGYFGTHVDAFFRREGVDPDSYEGHRFLNVARWFMDAADPATFAHRLTDGRDVLIQMATLDFIIPNPYTRGLAAKSGAPRRDYLAEHAFLVVPIEPEYLRGNLEMANFLAGTWRP